MRFQKVSGRRVVGELIVDGEIRGYVVLGDVGVLVYFEGNSFVEYLGYLIRILEKLYFGNNNYSLE